MAKRVETYRVMDALLACDSPAGEHEITLTFLPAEVVVGSIISGVGIAALVLLLIWEKRHPELQKPETPKNDGDVPTSSPMRKLLHDALQEENTSQESIPNSQEKRKNRHPFC